MLTRAELPVQAQATTHGSTPCDPNPCSNGATCSVVNQADLPASDAWSYLPWQPSDGSVNVSLTTGVSTVGATCACATGWMGAECSSYLLMCDNCVSSYEASSVVTLYGVNFHLLQAMSVLNSSVSFSCSAAQPVSAHPTMTSYLAAGQGVPVSLSGITQLLLVLFPLSSMGEAKVIMSTCSCVMPLRLTGTPCPAAR